MDLSVGDKLYCIAETDESKRYSHSFNPKFTTPREVIVVDFGPLSVSTFSDETGEPDRDENATSTFHTGDPEEYLFQDRLDAWEAYADALSERAERLSNQAEWIAQKAKHIRKGVDMDLGPTALRLIESGTEPDEAKSRANR